jgi:hypothetical protein
MLGHHKIERSLCMNSKRKLVSLGKSLAFTRVLYYYKQYLYVEERPGDLGMNPRPRAQSWDF